MPTPARYRSHYYWEPGRAYGPDMPRGGALSLSLYVDGMRMGEVAISFSYEWDETSRFEEQWIAKAWLKRLRKLEVI